METFISVGGLLLTRHEYSQGDKPADKVLKERRKLADKNKVRVISDEKDFNS